MGNSKFMLQSKKMQGEKVDCARYGHSHTLPEYLTQYRRKSEVHHQKCATLNQKIFKIMSQNYLIFSFRFSILEKSYV